MKPKAKQKPYWEMNLKELREATKQFDGPTDLSKTRPLTKEERQQFERARRGGSASVKVLCKPPSLSVEFNDRFMRSSMREAKSRGLPLYNVMESTFRQAVAWFEFSWARRHRRG